MLRRVALLRLQLRAHLLRDRAAQYQLAELYATGEHRDHTYPKDQLRAAALYRMAGERGCADAMYELGFMYLLGEGVRQDPRTALVWLARAGHDGHAEAMRLLHDLHESGNHGVHVDAAEATRWQSVLSEHLARHPDQQRVHEREGESSYAITIDNVPEQLLAAARERMNIDRVPKDIQRVLAAVWKFLRKNPGLRTEGHNVAMYWDERGDLSVEAGVQVVRSFTATDAVVPSASPGGKVARTAYFGPYHEIGAAHDAVRAFCAQHGHQRTGPFWEVYGDHDDDPRKLRTDIFYLLK